MGNFLYQYDIILLMITLSHAVHACVSVSDFIEERNRLARETFPCLQKYCQSLGLEFQVVDMRWGVRDENISYHQTSDVCIQEIHNCQRLSIGPSFVVSFMLTSLRVHACLIIPHLSFFLF